MLIFLTIVLMVITAYAFWQQGLLPAAAMTINVLLAGMLAFNFYEPLAEQLGSMFGDSFLSGYEDGLSLFLLFTPILAFLRWLCNALIHTTIEYHPILQQVGAALFGLLAGYLVAGFLVCLAQTLPFEERFLGFEVKTDDSAPSAKWRQILPPDRVWLALLHRASKQSLSWPSWEDDAITPFDQDGSYELRYGARRAGEGKK